LFLRTQLLVQTLIVVTTSLLVSFPQTPLKPLFDRHSKMKTFTATKNRMAPNSGPRHFAYDAQAMADLSAQAVPVPRPDESSLYDLPEGLHATYRALPVLAKAAVALISTWAAAATTFEGKLLWLRPLVGIAKNQMSYHKIFEFFIRTTVYFLVANLALQEVFTPPSRIATQNLMDRYFLPSKLSRYEPVTLSNGRTLGVTLPAIRFC
jgi:hypothetical protein